jgi:peptide/nickel transport system ATP-binding protein
VSVPNPQTIPSKAQETADKQEFLLEVKDLRKYFPIHGGVFSRVVANVKAVQDISFNLKPGEVVGLVGESGSGKTTAGRTILRLLEPTSGEIIFNGVDLTKLSKGELREYRKEMQIIFQDPFSSLNPRMTVGDIIGEALTIHHLARGRAKDDRVAELLEKVGMAPGHMRRYPHEFSGGQRQRIGIARALAVDPQFIVADEPVSALDVSIQAQVINLLQDLKDELGLTLLLIAHDLGVIEYISDRVVVMYLGKIMEMAPSKELYSNPIHPYTEALLSAVPIPDPTIKRERIILEGDIPSPINPPSGCVFRTRCPIATEECAQVVPPLEEVSPGHFKACIHRP